MTFSLIKQPSLAKQQLGEQDQISKKHEFRQSLQSDETMEDSW